LPADQAPEPTNDSDESAAAPADAPFQGDRTERRRESRARAVLPIAFRLVQTGSSDVLNGHTRNISSHGMALRTTRALPVGARFLIHLSPGPPDGEALSLVYRVTRCGPGGPTEADGFAVGAALIGRAAATPLPAPSLAPREILRRIRIDDPPRK
jgi:hypothetical protein